MFHPCPTRRRAVLGLLLAAATLPAGAASSTSSAASEGVSASVGSLSTSFEQSSKSSSKDDEIADGDYTVIEVAAAPARPGFLRLTLQREGTTFFLTVAQEAVDRAGVVAGQVVAARRRPFGVEFAAGEPRRTFFLALHDGWLPELQTRAVGL